ncbi:MAG: hypothetical protein IJB71_04525 [Bacilli bacterium]|nr:hypothetical protein [Bacilli bacterium]
MKNNNKILYISIAILVLAIGIAFGTYAYYQTTITGTISGNVAKWSFTANGQTSSLSIDLGDIYPGKSGTYNVILSAEDSELDVYYELYVVDASYTMASKLFLDSAHTKMFDPCVYPGVYGTITAGTTKTVPIYFNWLYDDFGAEVYVENLGIFFIEIVGQQLTGYTGSTPLKLAGSDNTYSNGYIESPGCDS